MVAVAKSTNQVRLMRGCAFQGGMTETLQFHYQSMIALIIVFGIHLSAGLYHRFINADKYGVWNRISFWGKD